MYGNCLPEQDVKEKWWYLETLFPSEQLLCGSVTVLLAPKIFSTHQDEPQEPQEPNKSSPEDTEVDELWASLEAAAKRKLPDLEQTPGAFQTRRRKKKRPGSTSP